MIIRNLFPAESMKAEETIGYIARKLAENNEELTDMLNAEVARSTELSNLLDAIGVQAEVHWSDHLERNYISLGFIDEKHPKYEAFMEYFGFGKEKKE